jgi:hypothetical protein
MKTIKLLIIITILIITSCNESEFLHEVPLSFYSPENSYVTYKDFEASIYNLYFRFRDDFYLGRAAYGHPSVTVTCSDLASYDTVADKLPDLLTPTGTMAYTSYWKPCYRLIYDANVIIGRSELEITELTPEEKTKIQAEARFFRGYMYKWLADIYGGVPIVLEETTEPKRDYVRASQMEVYEQSVSDLKFAAENLPAINEVDDSRVSNMAAYHALAGTYLSMKQWDNCITAATSVINNPNMSLMTERFGTRVNDTFNPDFPWASGGDAYWDLFRKGNQNRSSGNTEAIWVLQREFNISGGGANYEIECRFNPRTWRLKLYNDNGTTATLIPYPNTYYGGRAAGQTKFSYYFYSTIWNRSGFDQDKRNADYNIIRDLKVNNPKSDHNGKWMFKDNLPIILESYTDTTRDWYPFLAKVSSMGDHPKEVWVEDQTVYGSITTATGPSFYTHRDEYEMRLAETYLIRAEAYLMDGDPDKAADDINVIRRRAEAPDVESSEVDIDYILDERARELILEENRMVTLMRLGLLVERVNKYNPFFNLYPHQNLWPIPYSEIEKNTEAVLEQNPGYN